MVNLEKVRYPSQTDTQTHRNTNAVVALAQAEIVVKLELQVGGRLTDMNLHLLGLTNTTHGHTKPLLLLIL